MKWLAMTALMALAVAGRSMAGDIGVVDMERLIKLHPRTTADRAVLEKYVEDFESEREEG